MRYVVASIGMLLTSLTISSCGASPTVPSGASPTPTPPGLLLSSVSVSARLERWAGGVWDIAYSYCYRIQPTSPTVAEMTFKRVEYTTVGPAGDVYDTSSAGSLIGRTVGLGYGGCAFTYRDRDTTRAVATTYRMLFEYAPTTGTQSTTETVTGSIESFVPPQPFITAVTLTDDISDPLRIIRRPTPVTFTVSKVEGGTPPFLIRWWLNGVLLRDWDANPVLIWDGATLGGGQAGSGSYTLSINVRRSTWPDIESGAAVSFQLRF